MLQNPDDAVIWRGPRKNALIKQFLKDVDWGVIDYLVVDAPPGYVLPCSDTCLVCLWLFGGGGGRGGWKGLGVGDNLVIHRHGYAGIDYPIVSAHNTFMEDIVMTSISCWTMHVFCVSQSSALPEVLNQVRLDIS